MNFAVEFFWDKQPSFDSQAWSVLSWLRLRSHILLFIKNIFMQVCNDIFMIWCKILFQWSIFFSPDNSYDCLSYITGYRSYALTSRARRHLEGKQWCKLRTQDEDFAPACSRLKRVSDPYTNQLSAFNGVNCNAARLPPSGHTFSSVTSYD